jgi:hypothetical protein
MQKILFIKSKHYQIVYTERGKCIDARTWTICLDGTSSNQLKWSTSFRIRREQNITIKHDITARNSTI